MDVFTKFGDPRSNRSRVIRVANFAMDDERPDPLVIGRTPYGVVPKVLKLRWKDDVSNK